MTEPAPPTVRYHAISIFNSRTFWLNLITAIVAIVSLQEVREVIPASWMEKVTLVVAIGNIILRTQTVRPVALIARGTTKAVEVPKIGPPAPPLVTD